MSFHKRHINKKLILANATDADSLIKYLTSADAYFCNDKESIEVMDLLKDPNIDPEEFKNKAIEICVN